MSENPLIFVAQFIALTAIVWIPMIAWLMYRGTGAKIEVRRKAEAAHQENARLQRQAFARSMRRVRASQAKQPQGRN